MVLVLVSQSRSLPTYENYFILETSETNLPVDNQRPEPFSAAPPPTPENIIANTPSPDDSSNPMVDAISSNWDAEDIISNVEAASGPPPELSGQQIDVPDGRPATMNPGSTMGNDPGFQPATQQQTTATQPSEVLVGGALSTPSGNTGTGGSGY